MKICHRQLCLLATRPGSRAVLLSPGRRPLSSWSESDCDHVRLRCGSSGHITLGLHNLSRHSDDTPLLIYLPPFSRPAGMPLPRFIRPYPTVVIYYRWPEVTATDKGDETEQVSSPQIVRPGTDGDGDGDGDGGPLPIGAPHNSVTPTPPRWPTPLHDVLHGYSWITRNLAPQHALRRDIHVCGSYLGASLAAALGLTESQKFNGMAVRSVALHNGIYDWTTFLPGHAINWLPQQDGSSYNQADVEMMPEREERGETAFRYLKRVMPTLFGSPSSLFDPFASPCLFFHNAGFEAPPTFDQPLDANSDPNDIINLSLLEAGPDAGGFEPRMSSGEAADKNLEVTFKIPRPAHERFPPWGWDLKIPAALLLHESPADGDTIAISDGRVVKGRGNTAAAAKYRRRLLGGMESNGFASQAGRLAALMRRSIKLSELERRPGWDEDIAAVEQEADRRVRLRDVGSADLDDEAVEETVGNWLEENMGF
ncbi:hypothetical protein GGTG_07710 [Gaeumannomyces tritici R3-111a-1]|uniref:Alpha/beta hydrolase fold-3 domain-containing protein n=1 Tax=Gaeumannomyces tritici (strain R3-111a-1) TaxID=644352 RepID=J3P2G3_GAET3|nr:hypothetical protein GGTG_07710 [Gaeumannomyces tritici R3-111a-1]EJT73855.1 hypothetical protein GGTG_07710 [Gaeumannomyces tritici R3-111a-1]